jgi:hypothetical protein
MDNPEELATYGTVHKRKKNKTKSQHNTCWTPPCLKKNPTKPTKNRDTPFGIY